MENNYPIGEKFDVEKLIQIYNYRIETGYTTKNGTKWSDYKLEVNQNYDENGKFKGSSISLIKKEQ